MSTESYHCVCSTLLLVLPGYANLAGLPRRLAKDLQETAILIIKSDNDPQPAISNSTRHRLARIVRRPDGFEKRILWRCDRCNVPWAYELKSEQEPKDDTPEKVMYLLVDGLTSTKTLEKTVNDSRD